MKRPRKEREREEAYAEKGAINFNISPADRHLAKKEQTDGQGVPDGM